MRIAIFTETFLPRVDGVTNTLCHLLHHLDRRNHACSMFAPSGCPDRFAAAPIIGLPGWPFPLYPDFKLLWPFTNVEAALRRFQPDLIHTVNPISLGVAALRQARRLRIPVVASYHTDVPGFMSRWGYPALGRVVRAYLRWLHNQADLNLCPSSVTMAELAQHGYQRLKIWSRGVDAALFHPRKHDAAWRARLSGGEPDKPLLLFVGRLSHEKRVHWIRHVFDEVPDVRLAIVGDGPARAGLERLFFGAPVVFTGVLRGEDLAHAYASADVFVFPAANETLGNVVLEAMASGLPVVAPCSGGLLDHVAPGQTALLFEPEDRPGLVRAVRQLALDPGMARRLGAAGRARAESRQWPVVLDGLLDDYHAVIHASQARPAPSRRFPRFRLIHRLFNGL